MVKFTRVHVFHIVILFHLLNHFVDAWLFQIILPELEDSFVSLLHSLISQMVSGLPGIVGFQRISQEIQSLEHHNISRLSS